MTANTATPLLGQKLYDTVYTRSFVDRLRDGIARGFAPNKTQEARNWYRRYAVADRTADGRSVGATANRILGGAPQQSMRSLPRLGNMYMYYYDPKWAHKLPIYDIFPCTIVYQMTPDGFYGLNLHYLNPVLRANLMDGLYRFVSDEQYDEKTVFSFTYPILKTTSSVSGYKQCIKRYLYSQVRSRFLYVNPQEWDIAMFLPVEKFNDQNVYIRSQSVHGAGLRRGSFK